MSTNEILKEIRQTRDALARESGYDLDRLFDYIRQRERAAAGRGVKFAAPAANEHPEPVAVLREVPLTNQPAS